MGRRYRPAGRATVHVALLGLLALLAGVACTGGGGEKKAQPEVPKPLKRLWATPVSATSTGQLGWVTDDTVTLWEPDTAMMRGFDAGSGKQRWKLAPPKGATGVCQVSADVNKRGVGGVVFNAEGKGRCSLAAAVDSRTGEVLWSRSLGGSHETELSDSRVSAGEKTLTVSASCDEVRRMRLADGKPLRTLLPRDIDCAHDAAHNGRHLAVLDDPDGATKPAFALYDADKGEELWRREAPGDGGSGMDGVIADDPLTLTTTEKGHRYIRTFGRDGKPEHVIGKELTSGVASPVGTFAADGVLVTGYDGDPRAYAYDLRTGKQLWARRLGQATVLGVRDGQLLTNELERPQGETNPQPWLRGYGLRDGSQRVLGRLDSDVSASVPHGGRLYSLGERGGKPVLRAHAVPERGHADASRYPTAPESPTAKWRKGDLTPAKTATVCEAVTPETREKMKLPGHRPPPEDCVWQERYDPRDAERKLTVRVSTHEPETPGSGGRTRTAVEEARKAYDEAEYLEKAPPLRGLGDQAKGEVYGLATQLVARYHNVTVEIRAEGRGPSDDARTPSKQDLKSAARSAAEDVLKALRERGTVSKGG